MSPKQDPELFLRLWLDPFDFFPPHLQPQPAALTQELHNIVENDRYPFSASAPSVRGCRGLLATP